MNNLTRRAIALTAAGALLATLAACGDGNNDDAASGGQISLKLGYYAEAGGAADKTMRALAEEFGRQNPNIKLELSSAPYDDFFTRLRTQLAGGKAPDVWLSDGVMVQEYAGRNSLRDLSDFAAGIKADDYYGVELNKDADGKLFGFPQGAQTPVLFYNKKLFAAAKVAPPTAEWTYDDLAAAARKLTRDTNGDGKPDVWGMRLYSKSFTESWWPQMKAFGGEILADSNKKVTIDNPGSRAALDWTLDQLYTQKIGPDVVGTEALGGSQNLFPSGQVAMQFGIYARVLPAVQAKVDFDVAPLPKGPSGKRGNVAVVNSWVVNRAASDPKAEAAWKWITYFASEKPQTQWTGIGEAIPINKAVAASEAFLEPGTAPAARQVFVDALKDSDDLGVNPVWTEYTKALSTEINQALSKDKSVADATKAAQQSAQQVIDRFSAAK
ncbi:ABC transporter substrate-binding protein [Kribbella sp. CA-293567]|uniref:ABC transporter substrate-binding protein n=1 Tax=Kribbella sp. CA-293567 TaxID=3002436 RepID=UPI0022DE5C60|nr:sugar ABC transporter substrate-binding protein [Kribbella sp. CA-293567]WBQ03910.1 sugar ABC transporter substrate-binding protein [Kribbella sp. CA-293567]